jgi:hypothetical protein
MKIIALESFEYDGKTITEGLHESTEAEMVSMSYFGRVRPATADEIENAMAKQPRKETAARR